MTAFCSRGVNINKKMFIVGSDANLATNLPDLAIKRGSLATRLGIWNLATYLATFRTKI